VRVDDGVVATADPIALAPGRHVVSATGSGAAPFRTEIALAEGAQVALTVVLQPPPAPQPVEKPPPAPAPAPERDSPEAAGWVTLGGGVALMAVSAILLVVRHNEISDLNHACPGGVCPFGVDENGLASTRNRALVYGPVGVACGVAGIALGGAGIYWIASAHPSPATGQAFAVVPMIARGGAGVAFTGALR
jgi:hypothetical protein